eukprot:SAG22_NODE_221_length_14781_cov_82.531490_12_plen_140_part_00
MITAFKREDRCLTEASTPATAPSMITIVKYAMIAKVLRQASAKASQGQPRPISRGQDSPTRRSVSLTASVWLAGWRHGTARHGAERNVTATQRQRTHRSGRVRFFGSSEPKTYHMLVVYFQVRLTGAASSQPTVQSLRG